MKSHDTFVNRDDNTLILIAELDGNPVGYALGRIFEENETADNAKKLYERNGFKENAVSYEKFI